MNSNKIAISYSSLKRIALIFITLPMFIFYLGWLKWYWAVLACLGLAFCLIVSDEKGKLNRLLFKRKETEKSVGPNLISDDEKAVELPIWLLIAVVVISFAYLIFCGVGRLWPQSEDHPWRNAIFRDLITRDWPVIYEKYDGALCYYIGTWLPAAVIGKFVFFLSGNSDTAFFAGNIALLFYFTIGLSLLFLLIMLYFRTAKLKNVIVIIAGFIFFSGMDFVGNGFKIDSFHIEWWAGTYQYSAFTTCLCWVFNQTLISWICTALLLHEKKVSNYILIGMACLFSGPFPFIGYFVYCLALGIKRLVEMVKSKEGKAFAKEVASMSNIGSILFIFPIIASYIGANTMMGSYNKSAKPVFIVPYWGVGGFVLYFYFMLIEVGIYAILIAKPNKKNYLFYITILQLLIYPFFNVGINSDLTMRSSIPAIFMMYIFCYKYILEERAITPRATDVKAKKQNFSSFVSRVNILYITLVACLVLGAVTPCIELSRGAVQMHFFGVDGIDLDYIKTLDHNYNPVKGGNPDEWPPTNFVSLDYDDVLFFKYFARR